MNDESNDNPDAGLEQAPEATQATEPTQEAKQTAPETAKSAQDDSDDRFTALLNAKLKDALKPIQDKLNMRETQVRLGLTEAQYTEWSKYKALGNSDKDARILAEANNPAAFAEEAEKFDPRLHGQLPPGRSGARGLPQAEDMSKRLAEIAGDPKVSKQERAAVADAAFKQIVNRALDKASMR